MSKSPKIKSRLTREQALKMLRENNGEIIVQIYLDWDEIRLPIDELNDLVQEMIVGYWCTLGYESGISYSLADANIEEETFWVEVIADVDPIVWELKNV